VRASSERTGGIATDPITSRESPAQDARTSFRHPQASAVNAKPASSKHSSSSTGVIVVAILALVPLITLGLIGSDLGKRPSAARRARAHRIEPNASND
jgi:hypothetical protein